MPTYRRWVVGCLAGVLLALAAAAASATRLELPIGERGIRMVWAPLEFVTPGGTVRCNVTLEGSFHSRTFSKTAGSLIGYITRAAIGGCSGTVLTETLPWHVTYDSYSGVLPAFTGITTKLSGAAIGVREVFGATCLYRSSTANPIKLVGATRPWTEERELEGRGFIVPSISAEERARIPLTGGFCAGAEGTVRGSATTTVLGGTRKIRVGLFGLEPSGEASEFETEELNTIGIRVENGNPDGGWRIYAGALMKTGMGERNYTEDDRNRCQMREYLPGESCEVFITRNPPGGTVEYIWPLAPGGNQRIIFR